MSAYTIHFLSNPLEGERNYEALCAALPAFLFATKPQQVTCEKCKAKLKMGLTFTLPTSSSSEG